MRGSEDFFCLIRKRKQKMTASTSAMIPWEAFGPVMVFSPNIRDARVIKRNRMPGKSSFADGLVGLSRGIQRNPRIQEL